MVAAVALAALCGWHLLGAGRALGEEFNEMQRPPWQLRISGSEADRLRHTLGPRGHALLHAVRAALPERCVVLCRSERDDATVMLVGALRTLLYPIVLALQPVSAELIARARARGEPCFLLDLDPSTRAAAPADSSLTATGEGFELWRYDGERR